MPFAKVIEGLVASANTQIDETWIEVDGFPESIEHQASWKLEGNVVVEDETIKAQLIGARAIEEYKTSRTAAVKALTVTVDGMVFDADEESQTRMTRAALVLSDVETQPWRLYDNTIASVTKAQFIEAIRLAGIAQSVIWFS